MKSLDEIMSADGEAAPEADAPAIETPQAPEAPQEPQQPDDDGQEGEQSGMVPVGALHAERAKGRRYTEELAETRKALDELRNMVLRQQQPPQTPQQPQTPEKAPDWWDDPEKAMEHRTKQMLDPVHQALMFNARLTAEAIHKPETVAEAEKAFNAAAAAGQIDPEIHRRINSSPNPFHAAVQWHQHVKRQEQVSKFGDDPEAYIATEVERRLAAAGAQPSAGQAPTPMPTSFSAGRSAGPRTAPVYSGPKPLSEIMNGR